MNFVNDIQYFAFFFAFILTSSCHHIDNSEFKSWRLCLFIYFIAIRYRFIMKVQVLIY